MAKRKSHKKHKPHRRKRMGAINSDAVLLLIGGIAGAVSAHVADVVFTGDSAYLAFGEVAGGAALAYFPKHPFIKGFGIGVAAYGGILGLQTAGVIQGIANMAGIDYSAMYNQRKLAGYRDVPRVGDFPKPNAVGRMQAMDKRLYAGIY
jgi:hypothetical protein